MRQPEQDSLRELVKDLDRLLDLPVPEEIHEQIWELLMNAQEHRRRKRKEKGDKTRTNQPPR